MTSYLWALDQGTTSTRFIIFDRGGTVIPQNRLEHDQICGKPGWMAHDPARIRDNTFTVITRALAHTCRPCRQRPIHHRYHQPERNRGRLDDLELHGLAGQRPACHRSDRHPPPCS